MMSTGIAMQGCPQDQVGMGTSTTDVVRIMPCNICTKLQNGHRDKSLAYVQCSASDAATKAEYCLPAGNKYHNKFCDATL